MSLSNQTRLTIQEIIKRISLDKEVSLWERLFFEKYAKNSLTVWTWLKKANSLRRYGKQYQESINGLIQCLGLDGIDRENHFDPKNDDIADLFSGSTDWVRKS